MSFVQRIISFVANEVIADGLARNRTFQQFAIKSDKAFKQAAQQAKLKQAELEKQTAEFSKTFKEEVQKGMKDMNDKGKPK
eukprot:CAMPEP_0197850800 /NCGR_PEP_ID=MMETSP1438-20131217/16403_1 /TAXON_ID=1461541 /ORGANISM="Pterosperma sp., Strain CCMP1384" /LENGTH=80 /DNA_ID=CAMNT_0043464157 /DNA_START=55 /DNA_END=297 /DNA_ORIENTATION=-